MKANNLISNDTIKKFKIYRNLVNNEKVENILNRKFNIKSELDVVVSNKSNK